MSKNLAHTHQRRRNMGGFPKTASLGRDAILAHQRRRRQRDALKYSPDRSWPAVSSRSSAVQPRRSPQPPTPRRAPALPSTARSAQR